MNYKEILKEAFDSDFEIYKKCLENDDELFKEFLKYISKIIIKLVEKEILTVEDMQEFFNKNEIDKLIDNNFKDIKLGDK